MKHREILLFDEVLQMLKAFHEGQAEADDLLDFLEEHQDAIGDLLSILSKCFLFDDYYKLYQSHIRTLIEDTDETINT